MADFYLEFSEAISGIPEEELAWIKAIPDRGDFEDSTLWDDEDWKPAYAEKLKEHGIDVQEFLDDESIDTFPHFCWEAEKGGNWWISTHGDESGAPAHVAWVVQAFIKKFRPDFVFTLTWCEYCSKPRIGTFGGGWVAVNKDEKLFGNTWQDADEKAKALQDKKKEDE